ncbi:hypothetical protein Barb6XT_00019 [Bacteroidales bacterium Barb6XT]|nr:hypothetical protein Barb6XT_00019 [Bacteroidales bacterium Barb6XT]
MINRCYADAPKGQKISAPHAAKRNVGLRQVHINKVLKERYKLQTMVYNAIILFCHPFRIFPNGIVFNPTFRFAACGAEISRPFGTSTLFPIHQSSSIWVRKYLFSLLSEITSFISVVFHGGSLCVISMSLTAEN